MNVIVETDAKRCRLNRLSALSSLGTGEVVVEQHHPSRPRSQSPFGFKFTRNVTQEVKNAAELIILSQSPFGFKFTRNQPGVRHGEMQHPRLNRLSALSSLGTVVRYSSVQPLGMTCLNRLSALSSLGTVSLFIIESQRLIE